jgi:two-component system, sensor histidine kinase
MHRLPGLAVGIAGKSGSKSCAITEVVALCLQINSPDPTGLNLLSMSQRILVVEDNPTSQKVLETMLRFRGFECDVVCTGAQALRAVQEKTYSLVFMDLRIPNLDGFTATSMIRELGNGIPIVALTASAEKEDTQKCLEVGMNGYLAKPFVKADFDDVIERWLK